MGYDGDTENISPDGYMFYGKEEYNHGGKHMDGYFEMAIRMAKRFGEGTAGMRPLVLCACKVWYRIWGRLRLCKVSVRAA